MEKEIIAIVYVHVLMHACKLHEVAETFNVLTLTIHVYYYSYCCFAGYH